MAPAKKNILHMVYVYTPHYCAQSRVHYCFLAKAQNLALSNENKGNHSTFRRASKGYDLTVSFFKFCTTTRMAPTYE
jgi:hypothetical protein